MKRLFLTLFGLSILACTKHKGVDESNEAASALDYSDTITFSIAANLHYQQDHYEDALEAYSKLHKLDTINGHYAYRMAYCLAQLKRVEESVKYCKIAARSKYREYDTYLMLAMLYSIDLKNDSIAAHYVKKCLEVRPDSEDARKFLQGLTKSSNLKTL